MAGKLKRYPVVRARSAGLSALFSRMRTCVSHIPKFGSYSAQSTEEKLDSPRFFRLYVNSSRANRKVVAFFVLLKFGDSKESSLTVLASKSSKEQCSSGPILF